MRLPDRLEFIAVGFKADRFKTLMSSLGIIIGVMAIVVMLSVGEGLYFFEYPAALLRGWT